MIVFSENNRYYQHDASDIKPEYSRRNYAVKCFGQCFVNIFDYFMHFYLPDSSNMKIKAQPPYHKQPPKFLKSTRERVREILSSYFIHYYLPNSCKHKIDAKEAAYHATKSKACKYYAYDAKNYESGFDAVKDAAEQFYKKIVQNIRYTVIGLSITFGDIASHYTYLIKSKLAYYTVNKLLSRDC